MEVKKPTTFDEQVDIIRSKGFIVEDEDLCKKVFGRINYYRFSAYLLPFRKVDKTYYSDVNFKQAYKIYEFDKKVRALILSAVEDIELYLRTQLAYYHSHKYGALGYLDKDNFNEWHKQERFKQLIKDAIENNSSTLVVQHHIEKYEGKFPLWVIIEYFSTGMLSYFFSDLLLQDKKVLAYEMYNAIPKQVDSWLRCFTDLRNRCAHYSRLYFWKFTALPTIPYGFDYSVTQRLFDQMLVLKFLHPDKKYWNTSFTLTLEALVEEYLEYINLDHIGFPQNWETVLSTDIVTYKK